MKTITKYAVCAFLLVLAMNINGQIFYKNNMFYEELYTINPAAANLYGNSSIMAFSNITGGGMENAPVNLGLMYRTGINEKMGAGLRLNQNNQGFFKSTNIVGSYSYNICIAEEHFIHFGLSAGINIQNFDKANIDVFDPEDPKLQDEELNKTYFINEVGLHYSWDRLNVGFVAPYIAQLYNRYIGYASYVYDVPNVDKFQLCPNVMCQYLPEKEHQAGIALKLKYDIGWGAFPT